MMSDKPEGVLDVTYASERHQKPHLRFRLQSRALLAYRSYLAFGNGTVAPVVIDYGTADGLTVLELAKLFEYRGNYVGVEYSQQLIDSAPPLPENVKLLCGDVTALPPEISGESADLVTALAVLEHLPDPAAAISEAVRVLRPGGLLVTTCPDPRWDRIATALGLLKAGQHESHLDTQKLCTLVTNGGFQLVEYRRFMFSMVSFLPYLKIPVPTERALSFDYRIEKLRFTRPMFVNQAIVAKKL